MNKIYFTLTLALGLIVFLFYFQSSPEEIPDTVDSPSQEILDDPDKNKVDYLQLLDLIENPHSSETDNIPMR